MNRWHVYNYLKHRYMYTGEIPDIQEIQTEFAGIEPEELQEGMIEFWLVIRRYQVPRYELSLEQAWRKWEEWFNKTHRRMIG
ncbi:hypothetical protein [Thermoactinomyces sp. CICC 10521]|uniref:hypothetical protein n=1 Tax=Thermoactinomyces sp. CICC 10521 TaxID=2767426 RepID=UPI0018DB9622|nr:hypothetical protein [Thermoactinomyces sp. CICC 10521]MBH8609127.1 hypothetical protein [Thermoactinomyces sp. CICC 10521]